MAYTKQTWQDLPSKTTPINASRLGHIEQGIYDAASTADTAASDASSAISGLADKVDKVEGKGLSTNDFTDALKTKLDNIEAGAEVNVQSDWNQSDNSADDYIKNKPTLGTSAYKNSTSVVTDSTDLVESGAVKDIVGWGNKNLLPVTYSDGSSKSQNGVVFTKNVDGTITISIAQSATETAYYYMYLTLEDFIERGEKYIVNGFLDNNNITFSCNDKVNNAWGNAANSNGSDVEWTPRTEATAYGIWILVASGIPAGTYVVKPMISKDGGAYEPYHKSVEDSLAEKADNSVIGTVEDGTTASQAYAVGEHFIRDGAFCTVTTAISSGESLVGSNKFTSGDVADLLVTSDVTYTFPQGDEATANTVIRKDGKTVVVVLDFYNNTEKIAWSDTGIIINAFSSATSHFLTLLKNVTENTTNAAVGYVGTNGHLYLGITLSANIRYEIGFTYIL